MNIRRSVATTMLAALVTALSACASGVSPDQLADSGSTSLVIAPAALELAPGDTAQFTVLVSGSETVDVMWSVEDGGGTVSTTGLYTAPETAGTYHVLATSTFDSSETSHAVVTVTASPAPPPPPANTQGTGTTYKPSFITGVTGGGAMPSWTTNVVTASCAGDGVTDDTSCLQAAANAARAQNKPLVIPKKSSFYRITGPINIYTSVGGVGGMPTIKATREVPGGDAGTMLVLMPGMTGWIYNLNLVGTFNGSNAMTEHSHNIDVGSVNGVTISGNLLENAMGDSVSNDWSRFDGNDADAARNVIVDGNTMRNPRRCAVAYVWRADGWVITNNVIDKQDNFVSGIDFEPEGQASVHNVEIAYNKFVMNNRSNNPMRDADGKAVFGWAVPGNPNPGGNYYIHHNYGTFGSGFGYFAGDAPWGYIYRAANVEGAGPSN